jgi:pimeloyl-ACP methyl ester carboxylesterase
MAATAIIFVPGAWHSPDCFNSVIENLEKSGHSTDKVHLASVGPPKHLSDFGNDVEIIRSHIIRAVDAGLKVVLVAHSYGGIPSSEAIKDLDHETRQKNNEPGGVVHLFLCSSFIIDEGHSLSSAFGGQDLPWYSVTHDRLEVNPTTPAETFYNDMSDEASDRAVNQLKPHSYQTFHSKCTYAAWKVVPSTYLYCLKDAAIPISVQRSMVENTAGGYPIRKETVDASHSPFFSVPDQVADAIRRVVVGQ